MLAAQPWVRLQYHRAICLKQVVLQYDVGSDQTRASGRPIDGRPRGESGLYEDVGSAEKGLICCISGETAYWTI